MQEVIGTVDCFRDEMKRNVNNLEDKMNEGFTLKEFKERRIARISTKMKNKFEAESVKSETGSKNEENARQSVQKEIADIKEEVKNVKKWAIAEL